MLINNSNSNFDSSLSLVLRKNQIKQDHNHEFNLTFDNRKMTHIIDGKTLEFNRLEDEFRMIFLAPSKCIRMGSNHHKTGMIQTRGYTQCELIAGGYLRHHLINPTDISSVIGKYLAENGNVECSINNDHQQCTFLFPSMNQVCINFSRSFNKDHGCFPFCNTFQCGIIGITQSNQECKNNNINQNNCISNMNTFLKLLSQNARTTTSDDISFANIRDIYDDKYSVQHSKRIKGEHNYSYDDDEMDSNIIIVSCSIIQLNENLFHFDIDYSYDNNGSYMVTNNTQSDITSNTFEFKSGDCVILKYDKHEKSLKIELHGSKKSKVNIKDVSVAINIGDDDNDDDKHVFVATRTKSICNWKDCAIKGKNDKLLLPEGYDYVLACSVDGCINRTQEKTTIYTFSSTRM